MKQVLLLLFSDLLTVARAIAFVSRLIRAKPKTVKFKQFIEIFDLFVPPLNRGLVEKVRENDIAWFALTGELGSIEVSMNKNVFFVPAVVH